MCNLYSITTNQAAIIGLFHVMNRYVGNLPPMTGVFPDYPAPVVRNADTGSELITMRWGMPLPPRAGNFPVTNIRNTSSPHWRAWLKPENRCLDPREHGGSCQPAHCNIRTALPASRRRGMGHLRRDCRKPPLFGVAVGPGARPPFGTNRISTASTRTPPLGAPTSFNLSRSLAAIPRVSAS
jgi:hypothetical protein